MAHSGRHLSSFERIFESLFMLHKMKSGPADHMTVGNLYANISVLSANCDACAELVAGGAHMAAQIISIAEATKRQSFALSRTNFPGKAKRLSVFGEAAIDIAEWKVDIPTKIVDLDAFWRETLTGRRSLSFIQHFQ